MLYMRTCTHTHMSEVAVDTSSMSEEEQLQQFFNAEREHHVAVGAKAVCASGAHGHAHAHVCV